MKSEEGNYRYLLEPAWDKGQFSRFLEDFEVKFPAELGLAEMVDLGWLRPRFRVALPVRYIREWTRFPLLGVEREIPAEHVWADYLAACWGMGAHQPGGRGLEGDWYQHPFDAKEEAVVQELFRHIVPTGPGTRRLKPVRKHGFPRGVLPWVDAYGYWQIYEVIDVLDSARLHGPVWNSADVAGRVSWLRANLASLRTRSRDALKWNREQWKERQAAFDWLSRYRALDGAWVNWRGSTEQLSAALPRFIAGAGLTPDRIKEDVQRVFVPMWRRTKGWPRVRELLRQDIYRALDLLTRIPGERFSWNDKLWKSLRLLDEILPFEGPAARFRFERRAPHYIQNFPSLIPGQRYDSERFARLTERYWGRSAQFSRFCRSYDRMHRSLGGTQQEGALVSLFDETPTEHFLVCTLLLEKLLASLYSDQTGDKAVPDFRSLIEYTVTRIERSGSLSGVCATLMNDWRKKTKLHDLPNNPRNPLAPFRQPLTSEEMVVTAFLNFAILRNYFAHHDVLDGKLPYSDMGFFGVQSLLLVMVLTLEAA